MTRKRESLRHRVCQALADEHSAWFFPVNNTIAFIIVISTISVILETVPGLGRAYGLLFVQAEYVFLSLFGVEYLLRIWSSPRPLRYIFSFMGLVDFLSILPGIFIITAPGAVSYHTLGVLRILRVLRLLRTFRLVKFIIPKKRREAIVFKLKDKTSFINLQIYLFALFSVVILSGTLMYVVEGHFPETHFPSIPHGMWWALVTISTVGYGDLVPMTALGKLVGSLTIVAGLGLFVLLLTVVGHILQIILFGSVVEDKK